MIFPRTFLDDKLFDLEGCPVDDQRSVVLDQLPTALIPAARSDQDRLGISPVVEIVVVSSFTDWNSVEIMFANDDHLVGREDHRVQT